MRFSIGVCVFRLCLYVSLGLRLTFSQKHTQAFSHTRLCVVYDFLLDDHRSLSFEMKQRKDFRKLTSPHVGSLLWFRCPLAFCALIATSLCHRASSVSPLARPSFAVFASPWVASPSTQCSSGRVCLPNIDHRSAAEEMIWYPNQYLKLHFAAPCLDVDTVTRVQYLQNKVQNSYKMRNWYFTHVNSK